MPVGEMPEGTTICSLEEKCGDRGKIAKASGNYALIIAHNPDTGRTRVKLPSGSKKLIPSTNRAIIGLFHFFRFVHFHKQTAISSDLVMILLVFCDKLKSSLYAAFNFFMLRLEPLRTQLTFLNYLLYFLHFFNCFKIIPI